jgi:hypothetical protein
MRISYKLCQFGEADDTTRCDDHFVDDTCHVMTVPDDASRLHFVTTIREAVIGFAVITAGVIQLR